MAMGHHGNRHARQATCDRCSIKNVTTTPGARSVIRRKHDADCGGTLVFKVNRDIMLTEDAAGHVRAVSPGRGCGRPEPHHGRMGQDPKCGRPVMASQKGATATCQGCELVASQWWWQNVGLKGLG